MKIRWILLLLFYLGFVPYLCSLDMGVNISPTLFIPTENSSKELFSLGGGAFANAGVEIGNIFSLGPEFVYGVLPLRETGTMAQISAVGLSCMLNYYPGSRLSLGLNGTAGIYSISYDNNSFSSYWWKTEGNVGIRLSPVFTLNGSLGLMNLQEVEKPLFQGITGGLNARISINTNPHKGKVEIEYQKGEPLFPIFYSAYRENSFGAITLTNLESSEIRNVSVYFRSNNFTHSDFSCGTASIITKRNSADFFIYGDFSENLLNFSEDGQLSGEILVEYEFLGRKKTYTESIAIPVYNRNSLRWYDSTSIAAFVQPSAPEILDYSKYAVGIARNYLRSGLNRNMQFSMYLFEGLRAGGVKDSKDETTPYRLYHNNQELLDYIQFPYQTLSYKLGDIDDLALLLAATMESVGIKTAMIPLEEDFLIAYSLEINALEAERLFYNLDNLLIINNEVWMPLSLSSFREGFINSWFIAMENLNEAFNKGEWVDLIYLEEAWKSYSPAVVRSGGAVFEKPQENQIKELVDIDLLRYISNEFGPKIREKQQEIQEYGANIERYNSLGILYVRAGLYEEAKRVFEITAGSQSLSAMVNLGNIELLEENFQAAKEWFEQALSIDQEYAAAQRGLVKAEEGLAYE